MAARRRLRDASWMAAGAVLLGLLGLVVLFFGKPPGPDPRLAQRAQRIDLVSRMQLGLAAASEAEKSAVLALTEPEVRAFADQARASTADVERARQELSPLLEGGAQEEKQLLAEFSRRFDEFQRVDDEVLDLASKSTNLKASALAFGPAAAALDEMRAALSRLVAAHGDGRDAKQLSSLALGAEVAALHIQTLLPPHIAEATDARMDALEAQMAKDDEEVRGDLQALAALPGLAVDADLAQAMSAYARFDETRRQILALSRENTNVRSLSLSLNEKRKVMLACHEALGRLQDAIRREPLAGATYGGRPKPE